MLDAEGNTGTPKRRAKARDLGVPALAGCSTVARTQGMPRNLGDLIASGESRNHRAERKQSGVGATRSRSAAVGAMKWGNRPRDPAEQRVAPEDRNRERERWERRRAHKLSQRKSNG